MKRIVLFLFVCSVPVMIFLNAWQVYRYQSALQEVRDLEAMQRRLIEENKKALIGVEILSSPSRIEDVVEEIEGLEKRSSAPRVLIRVGDVSSGGG